MPSCPGAWPWPPSQARPAEGTAQLLRWPAGRWGAVGGAPVFTVAPLCCALTGGLRWDFSDSWVTRGWPPGPQGLAALPRLSPDLGVLAALTFLRQHALKFSSREQSGPLAGPVPRPQGSVPTPWRRRPLTVDPGQLWQPLAVCPTVLAWLVFEQNKFLYTIALCKRNIF